MTVSRAPMWQQQLQWTIWWPRNDSDYDKKDWEACCCCSYYDQTLSTPLDLEMASDTQWCSVPERWAVYLQNKGISGYITDSLFGFHETNGKRHFWLHTRFSVQYWVGKWYWISTSLCALCNMVLQAHTEQYSCSQGKPYFGWEG